MRYFALQEHGRTEVDANLGDRDVALPCDCNSFLSHRTTSLITLSLYHTPRGAGAFDPP